MTRAHLLTAASLGVLVSCASGTTPADDGLPIASASSPVLDSSGPATTVATDAPTATPSSAPNTLRGTVAGKDFVARTACLTTGHRDIAAGQVGLQIMNVDLDSSGECSGIDGDDSRGVYVEVTWKPDTPTDLTGKWIWVRTFTAAGGSSGSVKAKGQVEIIRAPTKKGEVGRARVSLEAGPSVKVEGEVDVLLLADL